MGTKWKTIEPVILGIAEDVLNKYLDDSDISFRYNEDDFIIIFAKSSLEESQLKCNLISAEIQRLLFEKQEEHEELKELKTLGVAVSTSKRELGTKVDLLEHVEEQLVSKVKEERKNPLDMSQFDKNIIQVPEHLKTKKNEERRRSRSKPGR